MRRHDHSEQPTLPGLGSVPDDRYGFNDRIGSSLGLEGAGPLSVMTGDQLHPMMVFDEAIWSDGYRWREGAEQHVIQVADLCGLEGGELVLDIGSGLGGPSRLLSSRRYGVTVIELNKVRQHLITSRRLWLELNEAASPTMILSDAERPLPVRSCSVDVVWSMNMIYHVSHKRDLLTEAYRVLRPGGRLMIDDWMFTHRATSEHAGLMKAHFGSGDLIHLDALFGMLVDSGFALRHFRDVGGVGRTLMPKHVSDVVHRDFMHYLATYDSEWGRQTGLDFIDSILKTTELYATDVMTYVQLVATKT